jgi:hypothetical protein
MPASNHSSDIHHRGC